VRWSGNDEFLDQWVVLACFDDVFLVGEIAEEGHVRYTGGGGDIYNRGVVVAVGRE